MLTTFTPRKARAMNLTQVFLDQLEREAVRTRIIEGS